MKEHSKKQLNNSDEINNNKEQDPFTKSFELQGEDLDKELKTLNYVVREFNLRTGNGYLNDQSVGRVQQFH